MHREQQTTYAEPPARDKHNDSPLVVHCQPRKNRPNLVILIHGLRGHRYGYWGKMPEFLFDDVPDADLGLYFYRTALKRFNLFKSIDLEEEARVLADQLRRLKHYRAIVLVGHSMGGILAKAAIANLLERGLAQPLRKVTGLVLLASPQIGSNRVPTWARLFSKDARALYPHSRLMQRIDTAFSTRLNLDQGADPNDKQTIPTWAGIGAEDFWVDALSAGIGIPENQKTTIRGSHATLASPQNKTDDAYDFVQSCIDSSIAPGKIVGGSGEIRLLDATVEHVQSIRDIALSFFGEEISPESTLVEFSRNSGILTVVNRVYATQDESRVRVSGYFCLIPIGKVDAEKIRSGALRGADLSISNVPVEDKDVCAIYIGAVASRDYNSRAIVLEGLRLRIQYSAALGIKEFLTRPVTKDGLRLAEKYGFRPIGSGKGLGELYALTYTDSVRRW